MTVRSFLLKGIRYSESATAKITIGGATVFDGELQAGGLDDNDDNDDNVYLAKFDHTVDDSAGTDVQLGVVIEVNTGAAGIGMFKYNYAQVVNPALTPEELAYVTDGTQAEAPEAVKADVKAKGGWYVRDADAYAYGLTPDLSYDNRINESIDGVALPADAGHLYNWIEAGSVLTETTIVFSSVNPPL
jgi:hypothetical protein